MKLIVVMLLTFILWGCDSPISDTNYFPLHEGLFWQYKVKENLLGKESQRQFTMSNLGPVKMPGDYEDHSVFVRRSNLGTDYYILQDEAGTQRVAKRTIVELKPSLDSEPRKILPGYKDLELGRSWSVESQPYALKGVEFHSLPDPGLKRFMMSYEITATDVSVTVPAGTFENCIEVTGEGQISIYADPRLGYQDILITQREWYAPGIGMIKLTRDEPIDLPMFKGGTIVFELEQFEH